MLTISEKAYRSTVAQSSAPGFETTLGLRTHFGWIMNSESAEAAQFTNQLEFLTTGIRRGSFSEHSPTNFEIQGEP